MRKAGFTMYRVATLLFVVALSWAAALVGGSSINYVDLLVALIGVSGVVVTVFGIWVAVIFPRFVASLGEGIPIERQQDSERYKVLIASLYRAALDLSACVFVLVITVFFQVDTLLFKALMCAFCLLCFMSLAESLFLAISNGELAASDAINSGIMIGVVRRRRRLVKVPSRRGAD